ncbi:hypothetical protein BLNAU_17723 [Blattamonas nauphoetae]|uniref:Uncharacterized protein n=1 Tax=Blattamonas nauphoetae TaxID=2049346 RepID=A0ABQ9XAM2_9EUKA|nr:hypothetical protein BLNAU_17723 [Blattamonas nauphoetae]
MTIDRILLASESSPDRNFVFTTPFFFPSSAFPKNPIGVVACSVAVENGIVDIGQLDGGEHRPLWTNRKMFKLTLDLSDAKSEVQRASGRIRSWTLSAARRHSHRPSEHNEHFSHPETFSKKRRPALPSSLSETMRVGGGRMRKMPNVGTATPVTSLEELLRGLTIDINDCQRCSFIILVKALIPRDFSTLDIKNNERVRMSVNSSTNSLLEDCVNLRMLKFALFGTHDLSSLPIKSSGHSCDSSLSSRTPLAASS